MTIISKKGGSVITLTAAQGLIIYLTRQKIELCDGRIEPLFGGILGIFGHGNLAGIGEALWSCRDIISFFRGQNEQGLAHIACGFAKANRCARVMGVTSSIGPGATNMVTAAALAKINRLPILFLPGDVFISRRPDPVLQQLENDRSPLETVNDCFIPVSAYFDRIITPGQLLQTLPQAIDTLVNPARRGPVTLALPQDIQVKSFDFPKSFFEERVHYIVRPKPDAGEIKRAARLLLSAKKPLMIIGGGVLYSCAEKTVMRFAEKHHIPFAETQAGKGAVPWDHPFNLGGIGVTGTKAANDIAKEADFILCVGTRLADFTTASKSLFHRSGVKSVCLNISSMDSVKMNDAKLTSDAKEGLLALSEAIADYKTAKEYCARIASAKEEWNVIYEKAILPVEGSGKFTDAEIIGLLNNILGEDDIIVAAAGGLPGELHKLWRAKKALSYHLEYGYSCMGYEIAGGIGVKMAHPDKEVYVLLGDGSYLMLNTELLTANQLGIKINVILFDNRGFGCINRLQKNCGQEPFGNLFHPSAARVDFVENARSLGCVAEKAESLGALANILRKNRSAAASCVTVIETDPQAATDYGQWWDVAVAESSDTENVQRARACYEKKLNAVYPNA